jgi:hypothetical protein
VPARVTGRQGLQRRLLSTLWNSLAAKNVRRPKALIRIRWIMGAIIWLTFPIHLCVRGPASEPLKFSVSRLAETRSSARKRTRDNNPQHAKDRYRQNGRARTTAGGGKQLDPNQREFRQMGRSHGLWALSIRRYWDWPGRAAVASGRWEHYRRAVRPQPLPDGTGENKSGARHLG